MRKSPRTKNWYAGMYEGKKPGQAMASVGSGVVKKVESGSTKDDLLWRKISWRYDRNVIARY